MHSQPGCAPVRLAGLSVFSTLSFRAVLLWKSVLETIDIGQEGITTLFVDYNGAIQLYRDRNYIDFASIIKPQGQKNTVDLLFEDRQDKQQILGMLQMLKQRNGEGG